MCRSPGRKTTHACSLAARGSMIFRRSVSGRAARVEEFDAGHAGNTSREPQAGAFSLSLFRLNRRAPGIDLVALASDGSAGAASALSSSISGRALMWLLMRPPETARWWTTCCHFARISERTALGVYRRLAYGRWSPAVRCSSRKQEVRTNVMLRGLPSCR